MPIFFVLNRRKVTLDVASDVSFLWVIREAARLTGTKYGCGVALCGACKVHLNVQQSASMGQLAEGFSTVSGWRLG
jgi:aerobic-type carbon monoxide dehydrogenase small subunit (CoxS/CutS family)